MLSRPRGSAQATDVEIFEVVPSLTDADIDWMLDVYFQDIDHRCSAFRLVWWDAIRAAIRVNPLCRVPIPSSMGSDASGLQLTPSAVASIVVGASISRAQMNVLAADERIRAENVLATRAFVDRCINTHASITPAARPSMREFLVRLEAAVDAHAKEYVVG